jgi:hypothetical protein
MRFPSDQPNYFLVSVVIFRDCGTLLAKLEYCEARTSEVYAAHEEINTQDFCRVVCLSDSDPRVVIVVSYESRELVSIIGQSFLSLPPHPD